jgi:hypothetical protein
LTFNGVHSVISEKIELFLNYLSLEDFGATSCTGIWWYKGALLKWVLGKYFVRKFNGFSMDMNNLP